MFFMLVTMPQLSWQKKLKFGVAFCGDGGYLADKNRESEDMYQNEAKGMISGRRYCTKTRKKILCVL